MVSFKGAHFGTVKLTDFEAVTGTESVSSHSLFS
jgi:hypothetical protein